MRRMVKVGEYVGRIKESNAFVNAVVALREESALPNDTSGLIYLLKDNISTSDMPTTCCSRILEGYQSPYDATVAQLIHKSDGVILGKTNMDEFAMGVDNAYTSFGQVYNPLFPPPEKARSPGGSSGGSAAAVAAGYCDVALGTDTGGSVRLPAAYCSVFGFKPSYGRISRYGIVSYAQSLDTVGLLSRSLDQLAQAFHVLDCHDPKDPTSVSPETRNKFSKQAKSGKLNIGIIREAIVAMDDGVREKWVQSLEALADEGHELVEVSIPSLRYSLPTYFTLSPAEASSNLARYDGIRYGKRADEDISPIDHVLYGKTRSEGFGEEVQRRLLLGTFNMTASAYEEHFLKAQKVRHIIIQEFNRIFARENPLFPGEKPTADDGVPVDILINPTSQHVAPVLGNEKAGNPVEHHLGDVLTVPANLAGIPAISVPVGKSIGMQIIGQYGDDATVLGVAEILSKRLYWDPIAQK